MGMRHPSKTRIQNGGVWFVVCGMQWQWAVGSGRTGRSKIKINVKRSTTVIELSSEIYRYNISRVSSCQ
jgi:hypothetical protein